MNPVSRTVRGIFLAGAALGLAGAVWAKLPPPSDEAKAKAAEAAAKAAHGNKVEAYKLCLAQDRSVAHYWRTAKKEGKPAASTCADPGPFAPAVAQPAAPTAAPVAAPAPKDGKKS